MDIALRITLVCIVAASVCTRTWGDVVVHEQDQWGTSTILQISGTIARSDVAKVAAALIGDPSKSRLACEIIVWLDSNGGDIEAAMDIGRLIHQKKSCVSVSGLGRNKYVCASACVLILAAGADRSAYASTGIHRPYSTGGDARSYGDATARYRATANRVKAYLEEMGMPARLFEEMMRVPAEKVRWLTENERVELGLIGKDSAYTDALDAETATRLGISKQDWLIRKGRADRECPIPPEDKWGTPPLNPSREVKAHWDCLRAVFDGQR